MTSIYTPLSAEGFELCQPIEQGDFERINVLLNGESRLSDWDPIPMHIIREDEGQNLAVSDSPWLGSHALVLRTAAIEAVGPLLRRYGELLPLSCESAQVWMYNPTLVIDALDHTAASVVRFADGRIMTITRYAFRSDILGDVDIFKIPDFRVSPTFFSQRFVSLWKSASLKGLRFKKIWTSE